MQQFYLSYLFELLIIVEVLNGSQHHFGQGGKVDQISAEINDDYQRRINIVFLRLWCLYMYI